MTDVDERPSEQAERKAGFAMIFFAALMGGPIGAAVFGLAIGIERAFSRSGWTRPGWRRRDPLTEEQIAERRRERAEQARAYRADARERRRERRKARREHRKKVREYIENGREGDAPERPPGRSVGEFFADMIHGVAAGYRLLDDSLARGNAHVNTFYGAVGRLGRGFWGFSTGFLSGFADGWRQHRAEHRRDEDEDTQDPYDEDQDRPGGDAAEDQYDTEHDPEPHRRLERQPETETDPDPEHRQEPEPEPRGRYDSDQRGQHQRQPNQDTSAGAPLPDQREPIRVQATVGEPIREPGPARGDPQMTELELSNKAVAMDVGGETNLEELTRRFPVLGPTVLGIDQTVVAAETPHLQLRELIDEMTVISHVKGAPALVNQCLEELKNIEWSLRTALDEISTETVVARGLILHALEGLAPAHENLADLRAAGAEGDITDRATS